MSDTPLTDAALKDWTVIGKVPTQVVTADFARQLERRMRVVRDAALEAAATKLEHYAAGLAIFRSEAKRDTALAAAKMVRDLINILP